MKRGAVEQRAGFCYDHSDGSRRPDHRPSVRSHGAPVHSRRARRRALFRLEDLPALLLGDRDRGHSRHRLLPALHAAQARLRRAPGARRRRHGPRGRAQRHPAAGRDGHPLHQAGPRPLPGPERQGPGRQPRLDPAIPRLVRGRGLARRARPLARHPGPQPQGGVPEFPPEAERLRRRLRHRRGLERARGRRHVRRGALLAVLRPARRGGVRRVGLGAGAARPTSTAASSRAPSSRSSSPPSSAAASSGSSRGSSAGWPS